MKKALLAAMCFILASLMLVNGTFAFPDLDLNGVFADLTALFGVDLGQPQSNETQVKVAIISDNDNNQVIYPGVEAYRKIRVENQGTQAVYFRLVYAIQYVEDTWEDLNIRFEYNEDDYTCYADSGSDWMEIDIDGTPYRMKVFTYKKALSAGENNISSDVKLSIRMDAAMTNEQIACYRGDFVKTQVLAIETDAFTQNGYTDAEEALNLALPLNADFKPF